MRFLRLASVFAMTFVFAMTATSQAPAGQAGAPAAGGRGPAVTPMSMSIAAFADGTDRSGLVTARAFLLHLLLAQSPQIADDIVARVFGGLDSNENADLVATLRCLAANSFDRGATAAELFIHRNTVLYRIQRMQKLSDLDLQNPLDQALVCLAILWTQIKPQVFSGPNG